MKFNKINVQIVICLRLTCTTVCIEPVEMCVSKEEISDGELDVSKASDQTPTPTSAGKCARGKVKKLTPEQLAARRRRLWVMIVKKEIPRVSSSSNNTLTSLLIAL